MVDYTVGIESEASTVKQQEKKTMTSEKVSVKAIKDKDNKDVKPVCVAASLRSKQDAQTKINKRLIKVEDPTSIIASTRTKRIIKMVNNIVEIEPETSTVKQKEEKIMFEKVLDKVINNKNAEFTPVTASTRSKRSLIKGEKVDSNADALHKGHTSIVAFTRSKQITEMVGNAIVIEPETSTVKQKEKMMISEKASDKVMKAKDEIEVESIPVAASTRSKQDPQIKGIKDLKELLIQEKGIDSKADTLHRGPTSVVAITRSKQITKMTNNAVGIGPEASTMKQREIVKVRENQDVESMPVAASTRSKQDPLTKYINTDSKESLIKKKGIDSNANTHKGTMSAIPSTRSKQITKQIDDVREIEHHSILAKQKGHKMPISEKIQDELNVKKDNKGTTESRSAELSARSKQNENMKETDEDSKQIKKRKVNHSNLDSINESSKSVSASTRSKQTVKVASNVIEPELEPPEAKQKEEKPGISGEAAKDKGNEDVIKSTSVAASTRSKQNAKIANNVVEPGVEFAKVKQKEDKLGKVHNKPTHDKDNNDVIESKLVAAYTESTESAKPELGPIKAKKKGKKLAVSGKIHYKARNDKENKNVTQSTSAKLKQRINNDLTLDVRTQKQEMKHCRVRFKESYTGKQKRGKQNEIRKKINVKTATPVHRLFKQRVRGSKSNMVVESSLSLLDNKKRKQGNIQRGSKKDNVLTSSNDNIEATSTTIPRLRQRGKSPSNGIQIGNSSPADETNAEKVQELNETQSSVLNNNLEFASVDASIKSKHAADRNDKPVKSVRIRKENSSKKPNSVKKSFKKEERKSDATSLKAKKKFEKSLRKKQVKGLIPMSPKKLSNSKMNNKNSLRPIVSKNKRTTSSKAPASNKKLSLVQRKLPKIISETTKQQIKTEEAKDTKRSFVKSSRQPKKSANLGLGILKLRSFKRIENKPNLQVIMKMQKKLKQHRTKFQNLETHSAIDSWRSEPLKKNEASSKMKEASNFSTTSDLKTKQQRTKSDQLSEMKRGHIKSSSKIPKQNSLPKGNKQIDKIKDVPQSSFAPQKSDSVYEFNDMEQANEIPHRLSGYLRQKQLIVPPESKQTGKDKEYQKQLVTPLEFNQHKNDGNSFATKPSELSLVPSTKVQTNRISAEELDRLFDSLKSNQDLSLNNRISNLRDVSDRKFLPNSLHQNQNQLFLEDANSESKQIKRIVQQEASIRSIKTNSSESVICTSTVQFMEEISQTDVSINSTQQFTSSTPMQSESRQIKNVKRRIKRSKLKLIESADQQEGAFQTSVPALQPNELPGNKVLAPANAQLSCNVPLHFDLRNKESTIGENNANKTGAPQKTLIRNFMNKELQSTDKKEPKDSVYEFTEAEDRIYGDSAVQVSRTKRARSNKRGIATSPRPKRHKWSAANGAPKTLTANLKELEADIAEVSLTNGTLHSSLLTFTTVLQHKICPFPYCSEMFTSEEQFIEHKIVKHQIGRIQLDPEKLQKYDQLYKNSDKKKCPICFREMTATMNWKRHLKTHSKERDYTCPICKKTFSRSDHMKNHEKRHLDSIKKAYGVLELESIESAENADNPEEGAISTESENTEKN